MSYLTHLLNAAHKQQAFNCGNELLNGYLQRQASQDVDRHLAACFVIADENNHVQGYYSLSNSSIPGDSIPENLKNKFPKSYNYLPVTFLGRLAREKTLDGYRFGETLLLDALRRCFESSKIIGSIAVVVDPIDDAAQCFYHKYGFIRLPDSKKMFLSMNTIKTLFKNK